MNPVVRTLAAAALGLAALTAAPTALAVDMGDIVVVSVKGEVHVTMSGALRPVRAGSVLDPPATLRTGRDGAVELRQGATTLSVGPETLLEFPALEKRGAPIDRIVQPRGNVFYNIGKREGRKLRIETPYLVGVVKGTQFNVAAQDETTTISLFEGLLEVHAADESGIVDLKAGEIASRKRDDKGVSIMKMDGAGTSAKPRQPAGGGSSTSAPKPTQPRAAPRTPDRDSMLVDSPAANLNVAADAASSVEATATPRVETSQTVETSAVASVSAPVSDASPTILVDAAPASVDTGTNISVSVPAVDVPASTTVDAEVENGSGHTGFTVVVGASNNQQEVTVGSANAADAVSNSGHGNANGSDNSSGGGNGTGNGNHGVDLTVDPGVDLGVEDDSATTSSTDTTGTDKPGKGPPANVVDVIDGLVRRRGSK